MLLTEIRFRDWEMPPGSQRGDGTTGQAFLVQLTAPLVPVDLGALWLPPFALVPIYCASISPVCASAMPFH